MTRYSLIAIFMTGTAWAQGAPNPPEFDAASIHPDKSGSSATRIDTPDGGRLKLTNYSVRALIQRAYDIQGVQVIGPDWIGSEKYDIEGVTGHPERIQPAELKLLLQNLLTVRFQMKIHKETRELTAYALVVSKDGTKLRPHSGPAGSSLNDRNGSDKSQLTADNVSMVSLASYLGNQLDRVVVDKTRMNGGYDFTLEWSSGQADSTGPSIFTALQEQLGLRLESQKVPVEVFVIDRLQRPSEN